MFNFNEEAVRKEHENGVGIIAKTQEVVDQICKEGFKNIFYIGIGGTILYAGQMEHIVKEAGSTIPLILENAADFNWVGNPHFGKDSIVAIASISGDTKEVVEAVDKAHEVGAKVIGYVEKEGSPLYEKCDYVISTVGGEYYFWYTVTLRFMANAGQFPKYDQFMKEIVNMPENVVNIYKKSDEKAKEFADKYAKQMSVKMVDVNQFVSNLSGGNKQKVVLARWIGKDSDIVVLDSPTRGIDIKVKQDIYQLMNQMRKNGKSIIMISEELMELIGMCDRIVIMKDGKISGQLDRDKNLDENGLISMMV